MLFLCFDLKNTNHTYILTRDLCEIMKSCSSFKGVVLIRCSLHLVAARIKEGACVVPGYRVYKMLWVCEILVRWDTEIRCVCVCAFFVCQVKEIKWVRGGWFMIKVSNQGTGGYIWVIFGYKLYYNRLTGGVVDRVMCSLS